jgi:hypothetical protein
MTSPKRPKLKPIKDTKTLEELIASLQFIEREQRIAALVDYLCDLRRESLWVMHELSLLDFDPVEFLNLLARQDDDDDDGPELMRVH